MVLVAGAGRTLVAGRRVLISWRGLMVLRIAIAGAGLLGRIAAWRLALSGHRVAVFDPAPGPVRRWAGIAGRLPTGVDAVAGSADSSTHRAGGLRQGPGQPWPAAGWTAAGMLSPVAELESGDQEVFDLGCRSLEHWAAYARHLPGDIGYRRAGSLLLAYAADRGAAARVVAQLNDRTPTDSRPVPIDPAALRELEPAVHGPGLAWRLADEGQVDTVRAMVSLAEAGLAAGVDWHWGCTVDFTERGLQVRRDSGPGDATEAGAAYDLVLDLRGLGARPDLPLRGVRGEIFWLHAPDVVLGRPMRLLHPRHRVYIVPRADGIILVGASEIESEDRSPPSVRSTVELLAAAHSVIPALAEARLLRADVNLRPAMPDNLPVVRREVLPQVQHDGCLIRVNGLFRHGWLIAPALIEDVLAEWLSPLDAAHPTQTARASRAS